MIQRLQITNSINRERSNKSSNDENTQIKIVFQIRIIV